MTLYTNFIVYPEGEMQEIPEPLRVNELVDLNGTALELPLQTNRIIAYRVIKVRHHEERGEYGVYCYVELVPADELMEYLRR